MRGLNLIVILLVAGLTVTACGPLARRNVEKQPSERQEQKTKVASTGQTQARKCTPESLATQRLATQPPLPEWAEPAPVPPPPRDLSQARLLSIREGARDYVFLSANSPESSRLMDQGQRVLDGQALELVRQAPWRALWPAVLPCLAGRPVLRLSFGRMGIPDSEPAQSVTLTFKGQNGPIEVTASALMIAPARDGKEGTWVIATAVGKADQRLMSSSPCCDFGYTLDGPVTVLALPPSEGAGALAADLGIRLAAEGDPLSGAEVQSALASGNAAAGRGDWRGALGSYEKALGLVGAAGQRDPDLLVKLARADFATGHKDIGLRNLIEASRHVEEQGRSRLLDEVRQAIEHHTADHPDIEGLHRLAELDPEHADRWWKLAEALLRGLMGRSYDAGPVIALAERLPGPVRVDVADVYIRRAASLLYGLGPEGAAPVPEEYLRVRRQRLAEARGALERGLKLRPQHAYGLYLRAIAASVAGEQSQAVTILREAMALAPEQPDILHELAITEGGQERQPVLDLNLKKALAVDSSWDVYTDHAHIAWSPDGKQLAVPVSSRPKWREGSQNERSQAEEFYLLIVTVPDGTVEHVPIPGPVHDLAWAAGAGGQARLVFALGEKGLWLLEPGGEPDGKPRRLAAAASRLAVSPDGSRVAYTDAGLLILPLGDGATSGASPRRLTTGRRDLHPLWSPDGRYIYYARDTGQGGGDGAPTRQVLARIATEGKAEPETVDPTGRHVISLDWFIPGRLVTVDHGWDDGWGLHLVGVDGKVADFGTIEAGDMRSIIPVPAKEWVLLQEQGRLEAVPVGGTAGARGKPLLTLSLTGWPEYPYPPFASIYTPRADPGGGRIAYVYGGPARPAIFVRALTPGAPPVFLRHTEYSGMPLYWSPDGEYLAVAEGGALDLYRP